eukprot:scaffold266_cov248-Pinguiococcus_pyrenoidosus.AAC.25
MPRSMRSPKHASVRMRTREHQLGMEFTADRWVHTMRASWKTSVSCLMYSRWLGAFKVQRRPALAGYSGACQVKILRTSL